jgi:hypothetical protein
MKIRFLPTFWIMTAAAMLACSFLSGGRTSTPAQDSDFNCTAESVLLTLRNSEPLKELLPEFTVDYSAASGTSYLNIWFVDPNIQPGTSSEDLEENNRTALRHASTVAIYAVTLDPCIKSVFDKVNPVIVDQNYNGWFSGSVAASLLPETYQPGEKEIYEVAEAFEVVYLRQSLPAIPGAPPNGSCSWPEARERLHLHFDPARPNVDFYFVGDEVSRKVTAQWDGAVAEKTDIVVIYASIMNGAQEARCLHPAPDYLYVMVHDSSGTTIWMGRLPSAGIRSLDLNQVEVLYTANNPFR